MKNEFYRFQVFVTKNASVDKGTRCVVGAAYLRDGHRVYTLRLWMFSPSKFYLMPDRENSSQMLIFTREPKKDPSIGKGKYFWNVIGTGAVDPARDVVRLDFDLLDKPVYMSIFPEKAQELNVLELGEIMDAS